MSVNKFHQSKSFAVFAVLINLIFIGNTLLSAWSLIWPTVIGSISEKAIRETEEMYMSPKGYVRNYNRSYLLQVFYRYECDSTVYSNRIIVDRFDSKQMCNAAMDKYKDKIKVYINPFNHKISTISPGRGLINALIINMLIGIITVFVFLRKPVKQAAVAD